MFQYDISYYLYPSSNTIVHSSWSFPEQKCLFYTYTGKKKCMIQLFFIWIYEISVWLQMFFYPLILKQQQKNNNTARISNEFQIIIYI